MTGQLIALTERMNKTALSLCYGASVSYVLVYCDCVKQLHRLLFVNVVAGLSII